MPDAVELVVVEAGEPVVCDMNWPGAVGMDVGKAWIWVGKDDVVVAAVAGVGVGRSQVRFGLAGVEWCIGMRVGLVGVGGMRKRWRRRLMGRSRSGGQG